MESNFYPELWSRTIARPSVTPSTSTSRMGSLGTCYPHIKRKYGEGEYTSKKWAHFDEAGEDIKGIHLAGTPEMKTLITRVVGVLLGQLGPSDERLLGFELCGPLGLLEYL